MKDQYSSKNFKSASLSKRQSFLDITHQEVGLRSDSY